MLEAAETYAIELTVLENRLNDSVSWPNWIFDINNPRKGYMSKSSLPVIVWSEKDNAYKYIISCRSSLFKNEQTNYKAPSKRPEQLQNSILA